MHLQINDDGTATYYDLDLRNAISLDLTNKVGEGFLQKVKRYAKCRLITY